MIVSPYITFKTDRQKSEWLGESLHPAIRVIVEAAALFHFREFGTPVVITHLMRTREEQRAFYPNEPNKRSVHEYGRGADLRTDHISQLADRWADWLNFSFPYKGTPGVHTALVHDIGRGQHLHIQVGPDERDPRDIIKTAA